MYIYIIHIYIFIYRERRTLSEKDSVCCLGSRSAFANKT